MPINALLHEMEQRMKKTLDFLKTEFTGIRTGKASPTVVENVTVDYYGTPTRIKELAGISTPEPRMLLIQPWDPTVLAAIEKTIRTSELGFNPMNDGKVIRIPVPELSEERRNELKKVLKNMAEENRVSIRNIRRDTIENIKKLQKEGTITEDDMFREEKIVQEKTDESIRQIDLVLEHKEHEIMEV